MNKLFYLFLHSSMNPPSTCVMRTLLVATSKRDTTRYPHPSDFTYDLPIPLHNVVGVAVRDYKFGNELLINENNKTITVILNGVTSTVTMSVGTYNNNITDLLTALNTAFQGKNVTFSIDNATNKVKITYTDVTGYIIIKPSTVLRIIGFPDGKTTSVCVYKPGATIPATVEPLVSSVTSIVAPQPYDVYNLSEMVVRIMDVETIMSNDAVTNRSTAVLFSTASSYAYTVKQCLDHYIPLLQQQSRLYDTINNEAVFLLECYCLPREC